MLNKTKFQLFGLLCVLVIASCSSGEESGPGAHGSRGGPGGDQDWMARMGGNQTEAVSVKAYKALKQPISTFILSNTSLEAIRKVTVFARVNAIVQ